MSGIAMSTLQLANAANTDKPYWVDARAWDLLAQVVEGKLSVQAVCERHRVRREDVHDWLRGFHRSALVAFDEQLRNALIRQGATPEALGGPELSVSLSDISIIDWIQAIQMFAKHAVITVMHDTTESRLWCSKGVLIDAESGRLSGEAALYRIVSLERGHVVTELRAVRRERTLRGSTSVLLLEAARRKDEAAMLRRRIGDLERRFQAVDKEAPHHSLNTAEVAVLRLFGEPRRLSDVLAESDLGDVETLAALESLIRTGHLLEVRGEPESLRAAGAAGSVASSGARALPISFAWPRQRESQRRNVRWLISTLVMAALVSLAAWLGARTSVASATVALQPAFVPSPRPVSATYAVVVRAHPPGATLEVDGLNLGTGHWTARLPRDGALHEVRVSAVGFVPARVLFVDAPPPMDITLEPLAPAAPTRPAMAGVEPSMPVESEAPSVGSDIDAAAEPQREAPEARVPASLERAARSVPRRRSLPRNAAATSAASGVERTVPAPSPARKKKPFVQIIEGGAASGANERSE